MHDAEQKEVIFPGDPGFEYYDDEERELIESYERGEWRPMSKQEIRELFTERGFEPPPLDNVVERTPSDTTGASTNVAD